MTRFFILILVAIMPSLAFSQKSLDVFVNMPDTLCLYLDKNARQAMVTEAISNNDEGINNKLNGVSSILWFTNDCAMIRLSQSSTLQLRLLPTTGSTSIVCLINTVSAPAAESVVKFYDSEWNLLKDKIALPENDKILSYFTHRTDSITEERYAELLTYLDPIMVSAEFSREEPVVHFDLSMPMLNADDRKQVNEIILQRNFKWDGKTFNEY